MLNSLAMALEHEKQPPFKPCERCGATAGLLLVSHDLKRCLCLTCFREQYPALYEGLYRWCQDHPPAETKKEAHQ